LPGDAGKGGAKELAVNRVENEDQHDRTPLLELLQHQSTCSFQDIFAELGKWFRQHGRSFRRRPGTKQFHGIES
jgi:hypothetical protein